MALPYDRPPREKPVARIGRAPLGEGRERSGPAERKSLAPRSATITVMIRAAFAAAKSLKRDFGEVEHLQISEKGPGDFVSHADVKAERTLRAELARTRPDYGFLGEEGGETKGDGRNRWIVDPLDGTTNFLHGIPHFAISIAVQEPKLDGSGWGDVVAGLVYQPITDESFWAEKTRGAWLQDRRLRVSSRRHLDESLIATGIPFAGAGNPAEWGRIYAALAPQVAGIRRFGAASLDLAWVAAGRYEGFWEEFLSPWDIAAGLLLVKEAGGYVSDFRGKPVVLATGEVLATNNTLHAPIQNLI